LILAIHNIRNGSDIRNREPHSEKNQSPGIGVSHEIVAFKGIYVIENRLREFCLFQANTCKKDKGERKYISYE
jgi:hypothetical protein